MANLINTWIICDSAIDDLNMYCSLLYGINATNTNNAQEASVIQHADAASRSKKNGSEIYIHTKLAMENALNGINLSCIDEILVRHKIGETVAVRGHISVRPETQVMAQQHSSVVHHKPPVSSTTTPCQYIVLDDLVRRAVQKEWLELDYGAQWWSNDHAPTIYANSKLIPSLNAFLSNRWAELKLILQKRPVAAKKIRLKKSGESTSDQQKDCAQTSAQPAVQQQQQQNIDTKPTFHQPTAAQASSTRVTQYSTLKHQLSNNISSVHYRPDIKPCIPQMDETNIDKNISSSLNQPVNFYSVPEINGNCNTSASANEVESIPDFNAFIPAQNNYLKPKSFSYLRNLIAGHCEQYQQNDTNNAYNPYISSCTTATDNSLKMKIKLNPSGQVARSKQHKKKVDENKLKNQGVEGGNNVKQKKSKKHQTENPKRRKRLIKVRYIGPHKIKKCFVKLYTLNDETLRKYTGKGIEDLKKLKTKKAPKKRRKSEKKTTNSTNKVMTAENPVGTDISSSRPQLSTNCFEQYQQNDTKNAYKPYISSCTTATDNSDSSLSISSSFPPITNIENGLALPPISPPAKSLPIIDCSPISTNETHMDDVILNTILSTAVSAPSSNKTDQNEMKTNLEHRKTPNSSISEKVVTIKLDNESVTSIKRSVSCDEFISLNKEVVKPLNMSKLVVESTNHEISNDDSSKIQVEQAGDEENQTATPKPATKECRLEDQDNSLVNSSDVQSGSNSNNSPSHKSEVTKTLNGILKRKERTLSSSPHRVGKQNSDYLNGKIIPLGQKASPTSLKRRSSEGSFDVPTISSCLSLAKLPEFINKDTVKKETEKLSPIIYSNKNIVDTTSSMDLNMNYKNNPLIQIALTNNITFNKNKLKEPITLFKDTDAGDSTDSNKENTFIDEIISNIEENKKKHKLDGEIPQSPKKIRLEGHCDESMTKCNLKIDLSRMKLEEEINDEAVKQTEQQETEQPSHDNIDRRNKSQEQEPTERPVLDLEPANFDNYSCTHCDGVFMHFKDWKMHYDDGHPKCAKLTAQDS
ncbi:uncharacterized protein isoform X2 [Rhodnius prolixus]|uniref:uncharacterized protein isoform X2 n=1 Tax=Rhodnius prolixus TaxID=13249 RepID=UPI003D18F628